jgi:hypothetical protein
MKITKITEIAWLAGILEGEGTFTFAGPTPTIKIGMTDKDTIEKVKKIIGEDNEISEDEYSNKTLYIYRVYGYKAISWMMTLYSFMSLRRKEKIKEIIIKWQVDNNNMLRRHTIGDRCRKGHLITKFNSIQTRTGYRCRLCGTENHRLGIRAKIEEHLKRVDNAH